MQSSIRNVILGLLIVGNALAQKYIISTYAGGAPIATPVDGINASLELPLGIAADTSGNVYFTSDHCVFRLDPKGTLTRVAGNSRAGYAGDGGLAVSAQLYTPRGIALDSIGNLYIVDSYFERVRKISTAGIITTVAGGGARDPGDGGLATSGQINFPVDVAADRAGNLYITEPGRLRKVSTSGIVTTIAGNGAFGYSGDGGLATNARIGQDDHIALDSGGNLYLAEAECFCVRKIDPSGIITTIAGGGTGQTNGDGGPAKSARLTFPNAVALDSSDNLYISETGRVRKVSAAGVISTVAGSGVNGYSGDGGPAVNAQINGPYAIRVDSADNLYIAGGDHRIRRIAASGIITTVAGNDATRYSGDGGAATSARMQNPYGVAVDGSGNLFIADNKNARVRRVSTEGIITTAAGNGTRGYSGDGGPASSAQINNRFGGVAADAGGNLYIADFDSARIRKISATGIISTVAGNGVAGYSGDGGPATGAQLNGPICVAVDRAGNLYIGEGGRVRKVTAGGIITTVAGGGKGLGLGDGGPATSATFNGLRSLAVDSSDNLYIADSDNFRVRKVSNSGIITTVAGNGSNGFAGSGDGGLATNAQLFPFGVAVDVAGNLYIADLGYNAIRKVSAAGIISRIAGDLEYEYSGDGGAAPNARFSGPWSIAVDAAGNLYVADFDNNAIRLLRPIASTLTLTAITNAASNLSGAVSPGEIVVVYGSGLGPEQIVQAKLNIVDKFDTHLAGTSVSFDGIPAVVIYASSTQVAAVVPYGISGPSTSATITNQGNAGSSASMAITSSTPALFTQNSTGTGPAAAINQDGSINDPEHAAAIGSIVLLFATGEGRTSPAGIDGKIAQLPLPRPLLPVSVTIGGQTITPLYAGGAPGLVSGLMQVNVQIPAGAASGPGQAMPVTITVGDNSSQAGVTLFVNGSSR